MLVLQQGVPKSALGRAQGRLQGHERGDQDMKESRCRRDLVIIMKLTAFAQLWLSAQRALSAHVVPPSRTRRSARCAASRPLTEISSYPRARGPDRDILLIPCPSATTYNMSGAGRRCSCRAHRPSVGAPLDLLGRTRRRVAVALGAEEQGVLAHSLSSASWSGSASGSGSAGSMASGNPGPRRLWSAAEAGDAQLLSRRGELGARC